MISRDSPKLEQPSGCGQLGTVPSGYLAQQWINWTFNWNGLLVWTGSSLQNSTMSQECQSAPGPESRCMSGNQY